MYNGDKAVNISQVLLGAVLGVIKNQLKKKGRPIPENDIWIGAIAKQHGLSLVSGDLHYKEIEGLSITEIN